MNLYWFRDPSRIFPDKLPVVFHGRKRHVWHPLAGQPNRAARFVVAGSRQEALKRAHARGHTWVKQSDIHARKSR